MRPGAPPVAVSQPVTSPFSSSSSIPDTIVDVHVAPRRTAAGTRARTPRLQQSAGVGAVGEALWSSMAGSFRACRKRVGVFFFGGVGRKPRPAAAATGAGRRRHKTASATGETQAFRAPYTTAEACGEFLFEWRGVGSRGGLVRWRRAIGYRELRPGRLAFELADLARLKGLGRP